MAKIALYLEYSCVLCEATRQAHLLMREQAVPADANNVPYRTIPIKFPNIYRRYMGRVSV